MRSGGVLEAEAERLHDVRRARRGRDRAIAVLGHGRARARGDERGCGRDVQRACSVAAGAGGVDEVGPRRPHRQDVVAHRLGAAGDLGDRLALRAQSDEKAADLRRSRLAAHDLVHHGARLLAREVASVQHPRDRLLDHRPSLADGGAAVS